MIFRRKVVTLASPKLLSLEKAQIYLAFCSLIRNFAPMNKYGTILIVDDNASILTAMHYLLDDTFERVLTTTQPEEILKLMAQQPVDLVLLDMNFTLGVNNGNEGLFWLRTIRKQHPQTPVVLLTAYADVNLAVKGLKNGAADFITKPWDNDELVRKLKDVLDMQNEIISLDEMEKEHIRRTIDHCHGNLTQAAELLGITRQTLYNKMKRLSSENHLSSLKDGRVAMEFDKVKRL
jgi:DNA-binding NtrC family response regulator